LLVALRLILGCAGLQRQRVEFGAHPAVQRLIQTKLTVGAANDMYEQEADRVASEVLSRSTAAPSDASAGTAARESDEEHTAQRKPLASSITPVAKRSIPPSSFDNKISRAIPLPMT